MSQMVSNCLRQSDQLGALPPDPRDISGQMKTGGGVTSACRAAWFNVMPVALSLLVSASALEADESLTNQWHGLVKDCIAFVEHGVDASWAAEVYTGDSLGNQVQLVEWDTGATMLLTARPEGSAYRRTCEIQSPMAQHGDVVNVMDETTWLAVDADARLENGYVLKVRPNGTEDPQQYRIVGNTDGTACQLSFSTEIYWEAGGAIFVARETGPACNNAPLAAQTE